MLRTKSGKTVKSPKDLKQHSKFSKGIKDISSSGLKIGFPSVNPETMSTDDMNQTAVGKAVIHNFGLGVPKRPFMAVAWAKNMKKYKKFILTQMKDPANYNKMLKLLGAMGQGDIQESITSLRSPENAPATIKAKGSSNPLIDTGHMRGAVTYAIESKT